MKILVCGGRDFRDWPRLRNVLDAVHRRVEITTIVHGAARGADYMAGKWARLRGVTEEAYPVDHSLDGPWPGAGPMRNLRMVRESKPYMVLAFPGGRGTGHMVKEARERGLPVYEVDG